MKLNNALEDVKKFHVVFEHPIANKPQRMSKERKEARLKWMREELTEFEVAGTIEDEIDAMGDEIYFCLGTAVEMGIDIQSIFDIIQHANMSKVWPDGLVHKNEHGKTIKPPNWEDPQPKIKAEIERQIRLAHDIENGIICPTCHGELIDKSDEYCGGKSCAIDYGDVCYDE